MIMEFMVRAFLSLGSNLGDRRALLTKGIQGLTAHHVEVTKIAGIYETEPHEVTNQPWFLNTAVQAHTELSPRQLLDVCLSIERANQRIRTEPRSARTLDIDIIFYADRIEHEPDLAVPHPRFRERKFVLIPLAEIAPAMIDPVTHLTVQELLAQCRDASVVRLA